MNKYQIITCKFDDSLIINFSREYGNLIFDCPCCGELSRDEVNIETIYKDWEDNLNEKM